MKNFLIVLLVVLLFGSIAVYMLFLRPVGTEYSNKHYDSDVSTMDDTDDNMSNDENQDDKMMNEDEQVDETKTVLGQSVQGRDITAYHYGTGDKEILFVGGIHGGYSPNTSALMNELMSYLEDNEDVVTEGVKVTVVPTLNPDGLEKGSGAAARFNANDVDLNRNFDCVWKEESLWRNQTVSGGDSAFSEPETAAIRDYIDEHGLTAAVVYYSAAGGVYASSCNNGVSSDTKALTDLYSSASGYPGYQEFDYYEISGDMVNWLAKIGVPAVSVLLSDHENTEWSKNKKGIEAMLEHYAK